MNFTNLSYFIALSEELNFTKTAKNIHISQQALSNHILKLEHELGVLLFDRGTPLTLTTAGKILLFHAKNILATKNFLESEIADIRDFRKGEIALGITISRGSILLPLIIPEFKKLFPQIKIILMQESSSKDLEDLLLHGKVDLIIGFKPLNLENIEIQFLCQENILLVIPEILLEQIYPNSYTDILKKLSQNPSLSLIRELPFITMDKTTHVGKIFKTLFKEQNLNPNISLEVYTVETMISLCLKGLGAIICPKIFIDNPIAPCDFRKLYSIHTFQLDNPIRNDNIYISRLKSKYLTVAAKEFIELAKKTVKAAANMNRFCNP